MSLLFDCSFSCVLISSYLDSLSYEFANLKSFYRFTFVCINNTSVILFWRKYLYNILQFVEWMSSSIFAVYIVIKTWLTHVGKVLRQTALNCINNFSGKVSTIFCTLSYISIGQGSFSCLAFFYFHWSI